VKIIIINTLINIKSVIACVLITGITMASAMTINVPNVKVPIDITAVLNKMENVLIKKNVVDLNKNIIIPTNVKNTNSEHKDSSKPTLGHKSAKTLDKNSALSEKSQLLAKKRTPEDSKKPNENERKKKKMPKRRILSLILLGFTELLGGATLSLLAPFYSKEAEEKGLSVTASGVVFSSVFVMSFFLSPFFGKYITKIGAVNMFVYGTIATGVTNIMFAFLPMVESGSAFLGASLAIRLATAVGEASCFTAVYPLAGERAKEGSISSVLGWMETMFGLGTTIGPFIGGLLYSLGGFYLPFLTCGGLLVTCGVAAAFVLDADTGKDAEEEEGGGAKQVRYRSLLSVPCVLIGFAVLVLTGVSTQWYQPSLEPYLRKQFGLTPFQASLFFMVDGASYALLTPLWGLLLDRGVNSKLVLICGSSIISVSYVFLAPLPPVDPSIVQVALATALHGTGMAANFIATLTIMMSAAGKKVDGEETEQLRGMVTSIWMTADSLGGFVGAAAGGAAYDSLGWSWSCGLVAMLQLFAVFLVSAFWMSYAAIGRRKVRDNGRMEEAKLVKSGRSQEGDKEKLASSAGETTGMLGSGRKEGYGTITQDVLA